MIDALEFHLPRAQNRELIALLKSDLQNHYLSVDKLEDDAISDMWWDDEDGPLWQVRAELTTNDGFVRRYKYHADEAMVIALSKMAAALA